MSEEKTTLEVIDLAEDTIAWDCNNDSGCDWND